MAKGTSLDSLLKKVNEALKTRPPMIIVEGRGDDAQYRILLGGQLQETVHVEGHPNAEDVLRRIESNMPPDYISKGIASAAGNKIYLTMIPKRVQHRN